MKIIIVGLGETGCSLVKALEGTGQDVIVIDRDKRKVDNVTDKYQVNGVTGSAASAETLRKAGAETADFLVALTHTDEINLISCMQGKAIGTKCCVARILMPDLVAEEDALRERYGIDHLIKPRVDLADEIFTNIGLPGYVKLENPIDNDMYVLDMNVISGSPLEGRSIAAIRDEISSAMTITGIARGKHVKAPKDSLVLKEGDGLYINIPRYELKGVMKALGIQRHPVGSVVIVGGGITGGYLAEQLTESGKRLTILEDDIGRCRELMEKFPNAQIAYAEGDITEVLDEEQVEKADAIVSLTDNDEINLVTCMYAWSKGIKSIITRVDRQAHVRLLHKINIDITVSPTELSVLRLKRILFGEVESE